MIPLLIYVLTYCGEPVFIIGVNGDKHIQKPVAQMQQEDVKFITTLLENKDTEKYKVETADGTCV